MALRCKAKNRNDVCSQDIQTSCHQEHKFVIFEPLSYCFEETVGFDVKASPASRPEWRLIR